MRGEDFAVDREPYHTRETPPHAWGRQREYQPEQPCPGNTPTCVGKTTETGLAGAWNGKHPHMRGEDIVTLSITQPPEETPPHAWGRP